MKLPSGEKKKQPKNNCPAVSGSKVAPPEGEMPKIEGPFWVVLVFVYSKGAVVRT